MGYDKEYYEANKDKFSEARKKWYRKERERKIALGLIKPKGPRLTEDEKIQRLKDQSRKTMERYHSDPAFREVILKRYKDRYHSDPEFRKNKRDYLRVWRLNRRMSQNSTIPQNLE